MAVSSSMVRLTRTSAFGLNLEEPATPNGRPRRCPASFGRWPGKSPPGLRSLGVCATGSSAVNASTLYQAVSLTKQGTPYALLKLQERGEPGAGKLIIPYPIVLSILGISPQLPRLAFSADHRSAATSAVAFPENSPPEARSRPAVYGSGRPSCRLAPSRFAGGLDS